MYICFMRFISVIFFISFFFSCEKNEDDNHESKQDLCEMCNSDCCEQIGTVNCCCSSVW